MQITVRLRHVPSDESSFLVKVSHSNSWVIPEWRHVWIINEKFSFRKFFFLSSPFLNQPIFTENKPFWLAVGIWFWRFLVSVSVLFGTMDRFIKNKYIEKLFWYSWYIVIGLSVSAEYLFGPFPPNFFSNDQNWLNQKMVKWGWGWTLYSVITFSIFINLADQNIMVRLFKVTVLFASPTTCSIFQARSNYKSKKHNRLS